MKSSFLLPSTAALVATLLLAAPPGAEAGCRTYWEGTAPFCNSSCPLGCHGTGQFSKSGNGGQCWSGRKQLCACCAPSTPDQGPCTPTQTETECKWGVMICKNVMLTGDPSSPKKTCTTFACGVCFGN